MSDHDRSNQRAGKEATMMDRTRIFSLFATALLLARCTTAGAQQACVGDCDGSGDVTVNELVTGVTIALGTAQLSTCPVFDQDGSGQVEIYELIGGVNDALNGCAGVATPTPS